MLCRPAVIAHAFALGSLGFQINHALQGVGYWGGFEAFSLCNGSLTAAGYSGNSSNTSRMAGFGEVTPQQDSRRGKNEQKVNFGTSVESCSKKLPDCRSLPTATFSGFTPYYWAFGNLPNRQQKSSKSVSDLLLHVPLRGGGYSVVNNKRGR